MKTFLVYHMIALAVSAVLDLIFGDPEGQPHPIRLIGRFISGLERVLLKRNLVHLRFRGGVLVAGVFITTAVVTATSVIVAYGIDYRLGIAIEAILGYYTLAARSLSVESMRVYNALSDSGIDEARIAVSRIVGRDTDNLDALGVARAAVETVAENTSDGVIAPMFYNLIGGAPLAMCYKAINTMDSMIGYHTDKYEDFGYCAAKLDDYANFIPARISAICMIISCAILGRTYSVKDAIRIYRRDRYNHKSPNSAQTESVCAGALGVRLAGDAYYFGELVRKPYIGDAKREIEVRDIGRACVLMYSTAVLFFLLCEIILAVAYGVAA